jgi:hypothetical protein
LIGAALSVHFLGEKLGAPMKKSFGSTIVLFLFVCPQFGFADGNKGDDDSVFTEPARGDEKQVLLGLVDYATAYGIWSIRSQAMKAVRDAEKTLAVLGRDPDFTGALALQDKINSTHEQIEKLRARKSVLSIEELATLRKMENDLEFAKDVGVSSTGVHNNRIIVRARKDLASARRAALSEGKSPGVVALKAARIVGTTVFALDIVGRIYVWNVMDKDPTLTPVGTFLWKQGKKLFSDVAVTTPAQGTTQSYLAAYQSGQPSTPVRAKGVSEIKDDESASSSSSKANAD